jgi:cell division protein FtsI/penicillin-binding protein 2
MAEERPLSRFRVIALCLLSLALIVLAQLLRYQLFRSSDLPEPPAINEELAPRGAIVDHSGTPVVVNRYFYRVSATPKQIDTPEKRHEVAQELNALIGLPYENTLGILNDYADSYYAVLGDAVSLQDARKIEERQAELELTAGIFPLQNVYVEPMTRRFYPQAELFSHVAGFVKFDGGGSTGVEEYYNEFLRQDGAGLLDHERMDLDVLPGNVRQFIPSSIGKDLVLTIDRTIQWICREELQQGLAEFKAQSGTIIVMNPHTGAILGLVNLPDYDPNRYETVPYEFFVNPAVSLQYEPGSVFKIITAAAALDHGDIQPTTVYTDSGSYALGERVIFNSDRAAHGQVTVVDALARSLNVVTVQIAEDLGADVFYQYVRQFGFGDPTNVDLSGEIAGLIKLRNSGLWSPADLATNSFGQGLAATPLQMINATAAIANQGRLMRPYVVQARIAGNEVQLTQSRSVRQVLLPETAQTLSEMMAQVIEMSNSKAYVEGYRMAGKSGTAQIPAPGGYEKDATIVSFVGFGPVDDPQIVLLVKMDRPDPTVNPWAGQTAAPVFSRVAERIFHYLNVPPDEYRVAQAGGTTER